MTSPHRHAYFIAGTDTGVGKTMVACALLRAARARVLSTAGLKPVAAGVDATGRNPDAVELSETADLDFDYETVNPALVGRAIAPHVAAAEEGVSLEVADLIGRCAGVMKSDAEFIVVEGAGGWRVPLNDTETMADLCAALDLPVILVVGMQLGCLNHALLTAEAIAVAGVRLAGWVANDCGPRMEAHSENLETLRARLNAPLLGVVPQLEEGDDAADRLDIGALLHD